MQIDNRYAISTAGVGSYVVTLKVGEVAYKQTLVIRADPLSEGKE